MYITRFACANFFVLSMIVFSARGQDVSLKIGESADLGAVYWQSNCVSTLKKIVGVDMLDGPPGVELHIREETVMAKRQNCSNKLPGGVVVLTAKDIPQKFSGTIKYRVRYSTEDGDKQSSHSKEVFLSPN
ncbi:MAG: hypothetical protein I8H77_01210 [Comamonadaceae bacterium]|nr:hypothetical protein [Comamonadaceae bacterium]